MSFAEETTIKLMEMIAEAPTEQDIEEAVCSVCAFGIAVLRGTRGDAFVQGYLEWAKDDTNAIAIVKEWQQQ